MKLTGVIANILQVANVDMLNGTPRFDIKPRVSHFVIHQAERNGWINEDNGYPSRALGNGR